MKETHGMLNTNCNSTKMTIFVVALIAADVTAMWMYLRTVSSDLRAVTSELDPPDVIEPPPPSNSVLGVYSSAAIVSNSEPCTAFGKQMLDKGGSAVDAAIATLLCDGVCIMQAMGVGGGHIMTIYNRTETKTYSLVARETAPAGATRDMFSKNPTMSTFGPLAAAVPGELKGYQEAHKRFGRLPWKDLFQPTIKLCEDGIPVNKKLGLDFELQEKLIRASPTAVAMLLNSTGGRLPREGDVIKLPQLAQTLRVIAESPNMADELYNGSLTKMFVAEVQAGGGIITEEDMNNYQVRWEEPVTATLSMGQTLYSAPLPGSGILVSFMLRLMDGFLDFADSDLHRSQIMIEVFKHAYGRRTDLGDPHFLNKTLLERIMFNLTDEATIHNLRRKISYYTTSEDVTWYGADYEHEDHGTNNIAVMDPDGNAVCVTSTINTAFGSLFVSKSTGILLNNQMDDFSSPGVPNFWGVSPSASNYIEPGKRPQSSMSPSVVVDSTGDVRLVIGAAGGTTITTQTTAVAVENLWFGKNIKEAIDKPRFHHQLLPMEVSYEYGVPKNMVEGWHQIGHKTKRRSKTQYSLGVITAIARLWHNITANYDWRRPGSVAGF